MAAGGLFGGVRLAWLGERPEIGSGPVLSDPHAKTLGFVVPDPLWRDVGTSRTRTSSEDGERGRQAEPTTEV